MKFHLSLVAGFVVLSSLVSHAEPLKSIAVDQAARIIVEFNHNSSLQKEIQSGLRHVETFITPDGTRSIMLTSHHDAKTNRLMPFSQQGYSSICIERYALHPQKDFVVALSEESCFAKDNSGEM